MNGLSQTHAEFKDIYLTGYHKEGINRESERVFDSSQYSVAVPFSIDWRTKGAVGRVKNQVNNYRIYVAVGYTV